MRIEETSRAQYSADQNYLNSQKQYIAKSKSKSHSKSKPIFMSMPKQSSNIDEYEDDDKPHSNTRTGWASDY